MLLWALFIDNTSVLCVCMWGLFLGNSTFLYSYTFNLLYFLLTYFWLFSSYHLLTYMLLNFSCKRTVEDLCQFNVFNFHVNYTTNIFVYRNNLHSVLHCTVLYCTVLNHVSDTTILNPVSVNWKNTRNLKFLFMLLTLLYKIKYYFFVISRPQLRFLYKTLLAKMVKKDKK